MTDLISSSARMTSLEISNLVGSRHDKVKQSIERLAKNGVIQLPPVGISEETNSLGLPQRTKLYIFTISRAGAEIFSDEATKVEIEDEGAGEFIVLTRTTDAGEVKLAMDAEEWILIRDAVNSLVDAMREA